MDIKIISEKANKIEFEIEENVGFLNALKKELLNDDNVKVATYFVKHPLVEFEPGQLAVEVELGGIQVELGRLARTPAGGFPPCGACTGTGFYHFGRTARPGSGRCAGSLRGILLLVHCCETAPLSIPSKYISSAGMLG